MQATGKHCDGGLGTERPLRVWENHSPEDVDSSPDYFDRIITRIIDTDVGNPYSDIGNTFFVFLGDPKGDYKWAEFMAHGVEKTVSQFGPPEFRLQWERVSRWRDRPLPNNLKAAQKPKEVKPVNDEKYIAEDGVVKWNPGKKLFDIYAGGEIVATHRDRGVADRIASGDLPLTGEELLKAG